MRVWDVHPGYLSRQNLLGQHAEIHAIFSVIVEGKRGYAHHPETLRWRARLPLLGQRHQLTVAEMTVRGWGHRSPMEGADGPDTDEDITYVDAPSRQFTLLKAKYDRRGDAGRIPLPGRATEFWAQNKYAVMARGYHYYREIQEYWRHHAELPVADAVELVTWVTRICQEHPSHRALRNVIAHLWGYFKKTASAQERCDFFAIDRDVLSDKLEYLRVLADTHALSYLQHSTVFVDLPAQSK